MDAPGGFAGHVESGILDLAAEFVLWNDLMGLDVRGEIVMFCFLGWRVFILWVGAVPDALDAPGGVTGRVENEILDLAAGACRSRG